MYIFMLSFVLMLTGLGYYRKEYRQTLYLMELAALTAFLALRFGQGSDYWGYKNLYERMPDCFDFTDIVYTDAFHGEIGWKLLMNVFSIMRMNFETVIIIFAVVEMFMIAYALEYYCSEHKMLGLLIMFPTVYLTYLFSTMRQGVVIVFLLCILIPLLQKRKYIPYILITVVLCFIHKVSLLLLLPLFVMAVGRKAFYSLIAASAVGGLALHVFGVWDFIRDVIYVVYPALSDDMIIEISVLALGERAIMGAIVIAMFHINDRKEKLAYEVEIIYRTYLLCLPLYFILMGSYTLAGRFCMLFKCVEVILLPMLLDIYVRNYKDREFSWRFIRFSCNKIVTSVIAYSMILTTSLSLYHLGKCSEEGHYYLYYNAFEFPYISVFSEDLAYQLFDTIIFE